MSWTVRAGNRTAGLVTGVVLMALAGCGGSDAEPAATETVTATATVTTKVKVPGPTETVTASPKPKPKPKPSTPPALPRRVPGNGTFLVGEDIAAGTYRNGGASPDDGRPCVAYASSKPSDLSTYLRGSTSPGPAIIVVNSGEYFTTFSCEPFTQ